MGALTVIGGLVLFLVIRYLIKFYRENPRVK